MEKNIFNMNNKIYTNNYNLLFGIINDLQQVINNTKDNLIIKRIGDIITKINFIINENKKNTELIINQISLLQNQMNKKFDELKINNNINNQELQCENGKYIGQVVNGKREGKGIYYLDKEPYKGDRYEGEWKNDFRDGKGIEYFHNGDIYIGEYKNGKSEGKGIMYYNDGDRYEGDWKNNGWEGKGIFYWNNGNRYEGDFKDHNFEGQGIFYYNNGDREMGDYYNDEKVGKHVILTNSGEVKINNY